MLLAYLKYFLLKSRLFIPEFFGYHCRKHVSNKCLQSNTFQNKGYFKNVRFKRLFTYLANFGINSIAYSLLISFGLTFQRQLWPENFSFRIRAQKDGPFICTRTVPLSALGRSLYLHQDGPFICTISYFLSMSWIEKISNIKNCSI